MQTANPNYSFGFAILRGAWALWKLSSSQRLSLPTLSSKVDSLFQRVCKSTLGQNGSLVHQGEAHFLNVFPCFYHRASQPPASGPNLDRLCAKV